MRRKERFFSGVGGFLAALYLLYWCWRVFESAAGPSVFAECAIELANARALPAVVGIPALTAAMYVVIKIFERWLAGEPQDVAVLAEVKEAC